VDAVGVDQAIPNELAEVAELEAGVGWRAHAAGG
jgi:hypothetical protein